MRALRLDKGTQIERMNRRQKYQGYSVVQGKDSQRGEQIIRVLGETFYLQGKENPLEHF